MPDNVVKFKRSERCFKEPAKRPLSTQQSPYKRVSSANFNAPTANRIQSAVPQNNNRINSANQLSNNRVPSANMMSTPSKNRIQSANPQNSNNARVQSANLLSNNFHSTQKSSYIQKPEVELPSQIATAKHRALSKTPINQQDIERQLLFYQYNEPETTSVQYENKIITELMDQNSLLKQIIDKLTEENEQLKINETNQQLIEENQCLKQKVKDLEEQINQIQKVKIIDRSKSATQLQDIKKFIVEQKNKIEEEIMVSKAVLKQVRQK
ncbi:Hypothetical_protein [Hexamita inflata]|uniref:Hypothetical_protein n=1 Tax=Hexamita inflata TaxID=28002 RepID=A0AA86PC37_9EUKA|nr:Hypothetical protein HINF_LOCUS20722 [Hexamita inflata]